MNEMINTNNVAYERYEELLLRRAALRKECFLLEKEYIRVFGEAILKLHRLQIECARKKKTIEFCRQALNRGEKTDENALREFIRQETLGLQEHYRKMSEEYEDVKNAENVSEADMAKIRKIYRRIVKLLHPDLHPEVKESRELQDLWNQVSAAYACNDLKELEELEILVAAALADHGGDEWKIEIQDLADRIVALEDEIAKIMTTEPYQYKFLLNDPEAMMEKKISLQGKIEEYETYTEKLDEILASIIPEGMNIRWDEI